MATHPTSVHPYVLQANEGEAIWYTTTRMTLKATSESTGGALSLVEVLAAPETAPPWHIHHRDSEMFYILEGSFLFRCGDEQFEAGAGSFVFLPGGMPHSFKVVSETAARFLVLGIPAGLDRYFVDSGIPAIEEGLRPQPVDPVQMVAIAARHGIEILGPPPF
jgi:mannose-6-phosphate isomerase-like protein (cupin superfamily)